MPKSTFYQLPVEKQERILTGASMLFAELGYYQTDVAQIAMKCGVAKGSLYNYFESKEDIYIHVCRDGLQKFRKVVYGGMEPEWDVYRQIEHIFTVGAKHVDANKAHTRLYLNISSSGMDRFAEILSAETESYFAEHFKELLERSKTEGTIRESVDTGLTAFLINGLFMMFLGSLVSRQFQIRIEQYLGPISNPENALDSLFDYLCPIIELIHSWLRP